MGPRKRMLLLVGGAGMVCVLAMAIGWEWWKSDFQLPPNANCAVLGRLVVSDAPTAAAKDAKRGDVHLVGVQGYTIELPGVPEERGDWLPSNYSVRMLPCTSDHMVSRRHWLLNDKARAYAAAYNQAALSARGAPRPKYEDERGATEIGRGTE